MPGQVQTAIVRQGRTWGGSDRDLPCLSKPGGECAAVVLPHMHSATVVLNSSMARTWRVVCATYLQLQHYVVRWRNGGYPAAPADEA